MSEGSAGAQPDTRTTAPGTHQRMELGVVGGGGAAGVRHPPHHPGCPPPSWCPPHLPPPVSPLSPGAQRGGGSRIPADGRRPRERTGAGGARGEADKGPPARCLPGAVVRLSPPPPINPPSRPRMLRSPPGQDAPLSPGPGCSSVRRTRMLQFPPGQDVLVPSWMLWCPSSTWGRRDMGTWV